MPQSNFEAVLTCRAGTVRDRLWMWSQPAGSYDTAKTQNECPVTDYGFTRTSRMTPAEGALYLGLPNIVFLRYIGRPMPGDFEAVMRTLARFKRVVWAVNILPQRSGPLQLS